MESGLVGSCGNESILNTVRFVLRCIDILYLLVPIFLILLISIDLGKNVIAKDSENMFKNVVLAVKRILMCLCLYLVPVFVDASISLLGEKSEGALGCLAEARREETPFYEKLWNDITGTPFPLKLGKSSSRRISSLSDRKNKKHSTYDDTIFIGDSRTVMMCSYIDLPSNEDCSISRSGSDVEWFRDTAIPDLKSKLSSNSKVNVAIMMGTNDVLMGEDRRSTYVSLYNDLISQYSDTNFVIISVTQVDDDIISATGKKLFNSDIQKFNSDIKSGLSDSSVYCDVYSDIDGKYSTDDDGIHYREDTSKLIYDSIHKCL